jgi:hypothetical protein
VNVQVTDVNDSPPTFVEDSYSFQVKEGAAGQPVGRVEATDADAGSNADVTFTTQSEFFSVDAVSGEIRTKAELDFETTPVHYVEIVATDGAGPGRRLSATSTVTVLVQDVSDEAPLFEQELYEALVPENVAEYLVVTVTVRDGAI